jgi:predicted DNA-binding protein
MFNKEMIMIGLRDPNLEDRLEQLAKETGRSKSYYVRLAIQHAYSGESGPVIPF